MNHGKDFHSQASLLRFDLVPRHKLQHLQFWASLVHARYFYEVVIENHVSVFVCDRLETLKRYPGTYLALLPPLFHLCLSLCPPLFRLCLSLCLYLYACLCHGPQCFFRHAPYP